MMDNCVRYSSRRVIYYCIAVILSLVSCTSSNPTSPTTLTPQATQNPPTLQPTSEGPSATAAPIQSTVSIWHSLEEPQTTALIEVINNFSDMHPNVFFDVLYVNAEELISQYENQTQVGGGPSLLLGPAEWGPLLYEKGLIDSLEEDLEDEFLGSLNNPAFGAVQSHGKVLGLPYTIEGVVLYRNKEIMTIPPNTYEDLVALAQTATQAETLGAVLERDFLYSGGHLEGLGGQLMDADGIPSFNDSIGLEWLQLLHDFERAGPADFLTEGYLEKFKLGEIGWVIDGTWNMRMFAESLGEENLAIDRWPTIGDNRLSGFVFADILYLSSQATDQHRESTLQFMRYLLSSEAQIHFAEKGAIPALREVSGLNADQWPLIAQAILALTDGATYPSLPVMDIYTLQLDIAIQAALQGGMPPEEALQNATNAILSQVQSIEQNPTPTSSPSP